MFIPPQDMEEYKDHNDKKKKRRFKWYNAYKEAGIELFDGTQSDKRQLYPPIDMTRLFQYDSCRGLEGGSVVCHHFDQLISYKMDDPKIHVRGMGLNPNKDKKKFIYLWSLIPLTRAIDTLIITLDNPNSEVGKVLRKLADTLPGVEWCIEDKK